MNIQELRDSVAYVGDVLRNIHTEANGRPLTEDEQARWDEGTRYVQETDEQIKRYEQRQAEIESIERRVTTSAPGSTITHMRRVEPDVDDVMRSDSASLRDAALKGLETRERSDHLSDAARARVEHILRTNGRQVWAHGVATMHPLYRSAFFKLVAGRHWDITPDEARAIRQVEEVRASLSTTAANGGYAIPQLLDPQVILTNDGSINPIRRVARVVTGMADQWEGITSAGVTARWLAEGVESTDGSPTLGQPTVPAHKANAVVTFSIEIGGGLGVGSGDWAALSTEVSRMFVDAKDRLETSGFATGSGSGQPTGIITALNTNTSVDVEVTTAGQLGAVDLRKTMKNLPARYRQNAAWMMSYGTATDVQALGDDSLGNQTVNLTADPFSFPLLNKPAYENSGFTDFATGTTTGQDILVVGDWENYVVYDRLGSVIELIPHKFSTGNNMPTGERMWYLVWRTGADSVNDSGFRILQNT